VIESDLSHAGQSIKTYNHVKKGRLYVATCNLEGDKGRLTAVVCVGGG
jgi:hypothetical protein